MRRRHSAARAGLGCGVAVFALACSDGAAPPRPLPATVVAIATPAATATAGSVAGTFAVRVTDRDGAALRGVVVTFTIPRGNGRADPVADTTSPDGTAATSFTVSTTPGLNEIAATVDGIPPATFSVTGVIGATRTIALAPRVIRLTAAADSIVLAATARDSFSNVTTEPVSWISRHPALVSATAVQNNAAVLRVLSRPGQTFVVASSGSARDSVRVAVQDASSTPCTFMAPPVTLPVSGAFAFDTTLACLRSAGADAEIALVAHYNTAVADVASRVQVLAHGITPAPIDLPSATLAIYEGGPRRDLAFELALRRREAREIVARVPTAREWLRGRNRPALRATASGSLANANVRVGDLLTLNVNAADFCENAKTVDARVAAISDGAIMLADTSNPPEGFTDAEYRAFGDVIDTLVIPVDTSAFGAPSDIDGNGRVAILFTKAVNALTPRSSTSGVVLGFYYIRDLLPRVSPLGDCPGSNTAEMFYLLVPDPNATVSAARTKEFVQRVTVATIAHEYQHLINASRRMYITGAPRVDEEVWLNEGLSHIAEELVFFRASGHAPRENIGGSQLGLGTDTRAFFDHYQRDNFSRYRQYLEAPESGSPLAADDRLATRGASWSFLRYLADRAGATDGDFWHRLVNSQLTGTPNLDAALTGSGTTTLDALKDWSLSLVADDIVPGTIPVLQQASWNFISAMPATGVSIAYPLDTRVLMDGQSMSIGLQGGSSAYVRFVVPRDREALIHINGFGGAPLPAGLRVTAVRIR